MGGPRNGKKCNSKASSVPAPKTLPTDVLLILSFSVIAPGFSSQSAPTIKSPDQDNLRGDSSRGLGVFGCYCSNYGPLTNVRMRRRLSIWTKIGELGKGGFGYVDLIRMRMETELPESSLHPMTRC